jgi:hypothetical protein
MVAALHLFRVLTQTTVMAGSWEFPMWLSLVGVAGAGAFSLWGFVLAFRRP